MNKISGDQVKGHLETLASAYDDAVEKARKSQGGERFSYILEAYSAGRSLVDACDFYIRADVFENKLQMISKRDEFEASIERYKEALLLPLESSYKILFESENKPAENSQNAQNIQKPAEKKPNLFMKFLQKIYKATSH